MFGSVLVVTPPSLSQAQNECISFVYLTWGIPISVLAYHRIREIFQRLLRLDGKVVPHLLDTSVSEMNPIRLLWDICTKLPVPKHYCGT